MTFGLLPAGRGVDPRCSRIRWYRCSIFRGYRPLREQARSHGLRPESRADLCITMSAGAWER
ncbi:hypothetical protein DND58_20970 [Pseudomonas syringae pv. pisi]|nr:hypothetical protein DND62_20765 [Pseudomonas syringae pv. pisi]PYD29403.1 hypothetical protein DND58_20970 [Pseudomonas syringae pv. pisi]PYD36083.1 hypothetical protein DND67_01070 [Pseudomonas syringae pv. pisi]